MKESRLVPVMTALVFVAVLAFALLSVNAVKESAIEAVDTAATAIKEIAQTYGPKATINIRVFLDENKNCTAEPWSPDVNLGDEVCFANDVGSAIYIKFSNPGVIHDHVSEIWVPSGQKGCVEIVRETNENLPLTLEYGVFNEEYEECSEPGNRPRIIIDR